MTQIKAFKAIQYNPEKVGDMSKVVCPPYDVISPTEQTQYHNQHPHNFIRILLGLARPKDNRYDNKYTRARKIFEEWLKKGILIEDAKPCIYFYKQEYYVRGQRYNRIGFIGLMRLQDKENSRILPHENTHDHAIQDRLRLWRNTNANLSPIFVCFTDREKKAEQIFQQNVSVTKPFVDIVDNEKVRHLLWKVDDTTLINGLREAVEGEHFFIADGHHRYEAALAYRKSALAKKKRSNGQEPFNFVMTYFTNIDSRDLLILPIHRVIRKFRSMKPSFFEDFFRIDKVTNKEEMQILLAKAGLNEHAFGMYTQEGIKLLRLKNKLLIDRLITEGSRDFRYLDATILRYFVLDRAGIKSDDIIYSKDLDEAMSLVDQKKVDVSFIMNPVKIDHLKAIALNGEKMPPKTTFFYPKVLSGLTISRLNS